MKLQTIACAVAIATGGFFFTHAINEAIAATETTAVTKQAIVPSQEQALVSRQLATLVDRQHYLNQRLDAKTSARIRRPAAPTSTVSRRPKSSMSTSRSIPCRGSAGLGFVAVAEWGQR